MSQTNPAAPVATPVPDNQRMNTLPRVFGPRHMMRAESLVYAWMGRFCEAYQSAYWEYYTAPQGVFYMAPREAWHFAFAWHGIECELSADAAGIVASLFAFGQLCNETELDQHIELYHALRDFAKDHAESKWIFKLID